MVRESIEIEQRKLQRVRYKQIAVDDKQLNRRSKSVKVLKNSDRLINLKEK